MKVPCRDNIDPFRLPVELAEAVVGLLVEDCCVAAGAIYTSNDLGQSSGWHLLRNMGCKHCSEEN